MELSGITEGLREVFRMGANAYEAMSCAGNVVLPVQFAQMVFATLKKKRVCITA
jgi:hypothetical protein